MKVAAVAGRVDRSHLHSEEYREYLASDRWRVVRAAALDRAGHRCADCGATKRLEVHHLSYAHLGAEAWGELRVLCYGCHLAADRRREHARRRR